MIPKTRKRKRKKKERKGRLGEEEKSSGCPEDSGQRGNRDVEEGSRGERRRLPLGKEDEGDSWREGGALAVWKGRELS